MPSKKKEKAPPVLVDPFADLCAALDASGKACNARTKEASRWCPRHDEVSGTPFDAFPRVADLGSAGAHQALCQLQGTPLCARRVSRPHFMPQCRRSQGLHIVGNDPGME